MRRQVTQGHNVLVSMFIVVFYLYSVILLCRFYGWKDSTKNKTSILTLVIILTNLVKTLRDQPHSTSHTVHIHNSKTREPKLEHLVDLKASLLYSGYSEHLPSDAVISSSHFHAIPSYLIV